MDRVVRRGWAWLARHVPAAASTTTWWLVGLASTGLVVVGIEGSQSDVGPEDRQVGWGLRKLGQALQDLYDLLPWGNTDLPMPARQWPVTFSLVVGTVGCTLAVVRFAARASWFNRLWTTTAAIVGLWALVLALPSVLSAEVGAIGSWLRLPFAVVAALLTAKLVLLYRAAAGFVHRAPVAPTLLSNQQRVRDELQVDATKGVAFDDFRLMQVTGGWGTGKSQLVLRLRADCFHEPRRWLALRRKPRPPIVLACVDIWKHESDVDLHRSIVDTVFSHPACMLPWGWLHYPVMSSLVSYVRSSDLHIPVIGTSVSLPVALPRLSWQRPLERAVSRCVARGARVVVVFDELDRASDAVAQAALTMVHRSFDLPGVTVILVHVPDILDVKAFSPLTTQLPDLRSNATARILIELAQRQRRPREEEDQERWPALVAAVEARWAKGETVPAERDESRILDHAVALAYGQLDHDGRARVRASLREKYLGSRDLRIQPLTARDVRDMFAWPALSDLLRRRMGGAAPTEVDLIAVGDAIEKVVDDWQRAPGRAIVGDQQMIRPIELPPVRHILNAVERELHSIPLLPEPLTVTDAVVLVEAALTTAVITHRKVPHVS